MLIPWRYFYTQLNLSLSRRTCTFRKKCLEMFHTHSFCIIFMMFFFTFRTMARAHDYAGNKAFLSIHLINKKVQWFNVFSLCKCLLARGFQFFFSFSSLFFFQISAQEIIFLDNARRLEFHYEMVKCNEFIWFIFDASNFI